MAGTQDKVDKALVPVGAALVVLLIVAIALGAWAGAYYCF